MVLTLAQFIVLGLIQGITEWLPISSSAMTSLVMANFYGINDVGTLLHESLFLHLGTFFAALIYFRKDVTELFVSIFHYKNSKKDTKKLLNFLIISTIITAVIGLIILKAITSDITSQITGKIITLIITLFLFVTAFIQLYVKKTGVKKINDLQKNDSVVLGFAQGLSVLPGVSRSGITVSTLLLKKFDDTSALKMSFLMSLPVVLLGNIFLNMGGIVSTGINYASIIGVLVSFVFGLLTIHGLVKISNKINFGWFVLTFAVLMLISLFF